LSDKLPLCEDCSTQKGCDQKNCFRDRFHSRYVFAVINDHQSRGFHLFESSYFPHYAIFSALFP
jgi:hypothetical protein